MGKDGADGARNAGLGKKKEHEEASCTVEGYEEKKGQLQDKRPPGERKVRKGWDGEELREQ